MSKFLFAGSRIILNAERRSILFKRNNLLPVLTQQRFNSSNSVTNSIGNQGIHSTLDSLGVDASLALNQEVSSAISTVAATDAGFISSNIMSMIDNLHLVAGIPYWEAIIAATIGLRICLLPISLTTVRGAARLAAARPEIEKITNIYNNNANTGDNRTAQQHQLELQAIYKKFQVNPISAAVGPLVQLPIFISCFWALRDMGIYYPDFATGGALWFTNLAAPDPLMIFPIVNSITFLAMIEMGADGVKVASQSTFKWAMRGLGVAMVPLCMSFPQGLLVYWTANNTFSVLQTLILKNPKLKKYFNIPESPSADAAPTLKMSNPFKTLVEAMSKERTQPLNAPAEFIGTTITNSTTNQTPADANIARPRYSAAASSSTENTVTNTSTVNIPPPPVTFAAPPKKAKKARKM